MSSTEFHTDLPDGSSTLRLRRVFAAYPTGIVAVAGTVDGEIAGLSANSFTSVSLEPPFISLSFASTSTTWPRLRECEVLGISVLAEDQADISQQLRRPSAERFRGLEVRTDRSAVHLVGALATLTVAPVDEFSAGDHSIALFRVINARRRLDGRPLVFFDSALRQVADTASR
ncbi:flavin reductase family protein [Microbacterium sp. NPDC079995]|uniref:flavin reductase family protein n=1 Tax=unclassified Microbacterium TaxID=2609290 RepID=UPI00344B5401